MVVAGTRVVLTAVTLFAWFATGLMVATIGQGHAGQLVISQRITTIQLDGTQYFISRMNPYSPELSYFLAYEYCRSIGLQLASFETLEKTNSISDFLRNAGYNKFDYWTSGNRLGTDMLIWMSTGLPFNTTFNQMKRPSPDGNGLDNEELKMSARPELPIARKKRGESDSRDGCVAIKAPNMDWVTADCSDLKDFICEQTRCYYYNYGSIPVSSSQGFSHKPKHPPAAALYSTAIPSAVNNTAPIPNPTIITSTTIPPTTTTSTSATITTTPTIITSTDVNTSPVFKTTTSGTTTTTMTTTTTTTASEPVDEQASVESAGLETDWTAATTLADQTATERQTFPQESQTEQQPTVASEQQSDYYTTTELPSLIQIHNLQQHEQQLHDRLQRNDQPENDQESHEAREHNGGTYAFESLEKAFATAVPHKIRATKDLEQQPKDVASGDAPLPWSWAKDIMLQKPVLRKTSQEVV